MLGLEGAEEGVAKGPLARCALAWYGNSLTGTSRGMVFDQVLEVIIVDVDCGWKGGISNSSDGWAQREAIEDSQWPHCGIERWRRVSPYFIVYQVMRNRHRSQTMT